MSNLQHFNKDDVEYAQTMAKISLHKEKEENKITDFQSTSPSSQVTKFHLDDNSNSEYKESKDINCYSSRTISNTNKKLLPNSFSVSSAKYKFKENRMWLRQAAKISHNIVETMESLKKKSQKRSPVTFMTPLEISTKQKRWEEFSHLARKSLLSLKREVNMLSLKISVPLERVPSNSLRLLSSASRSCLHLLKGFEAFPEEIKVGQKGNPLLCEALIIAQQILLIFAMGGIAYPIKTPFQLKKEESSDKEESGTDVSEIMTSELDSDALLLIKPKAVKKKLSLLVHSKIANSHGFKKKKPVRIIAPLKEKEIDGIPLAHSGEEILSEGRRIQLIHDSLSPKLLKRRTTIQMKGERGANKSSSVATTREEQKGKNSNSYDLSEKMADAVFERIFPYVRNTVNEASKEINPPRNSHIDMEAYLKAQKKIEELQKRIDLLENVADRQAQFVARVTRQSECSEEDTKHIMDLDEAIQKATVSLQKTVVVDYQRNPSLEHTMSKENHVSDTTYPLGVLREATIENYGCETASRVEPSIYDHVRCQKLEFWSSLVDNRYIVAPEYKDNEKAVNENITQEETKEAIIPTATNNPDMTATEVSSDCHRAKEDLVSLDDAKFGSPKDSERLPTSHSNIIAVERSSNNPSSNDAEQSNKISVNIVEDASYIQSNDNSERKSNQTSDYSVELASYLQSSDNSERQSKQITDNRVELDSHKRSSDESVKVAEENEQKDLPLSDHS